MTDRPEGILDALLALRVKTPRLELRIPESGAWSVFAAEIAGRVVPAESAHFVGSWAQLVPPESEEAFVAARERTLGACTRKRWGIELGAFDRSRLVGQASLYARDWSASREVITASLVHPEHRGRGLGTEMRSGVLALAFTVLGADVAWSGASFDNVASNRVSEKLGYEHLGEQAKRTGGGEMRFTRLRLTAQAWRPDPAIVVTAGADAVRAALR